MVQDWWDKLSALWLQPQCGLCQRPAPEGICPACWGKIAIAQRSQPPQLEPEALPVLAWGHYGDGLKRAIAALKYDGQPTLGEPLGRALGRQWQATPIPTPRPPLVVPIPLHPDKLKQRGFNQAEVLAIAFCRETGLTLVAKGLERQRATLPQFSLGAAERQENLAGAFCLGPGLQRRRPTQPILLLDDIYTTGATARTTAALLRRQGWSVAGMVVVARGD